MQVMYTFLHLCVKSMTNIRRSLESDYNYVLKSLTQQRFHLIMFI